MLCDLEAIFLSGEKLPLPHTHRIVDSMTYQENLDPKSLQSPEQAVKKETAHYFEATEIAKGKQLEILKCETGNFFTRKKTELKQRAKTIGRETELKEIIVREGARTLLGDTRTTKIKQALLIGGSANPQRNVLPARNETHTH